MKNKVLIGLVIVVCSVLIFISGIAIGKSVAEKSVSSINESYNNYVAETTTAAVETTEEEMSTEDIESAVETTASEVVETTKAITEEEVYSSIAADKEIYVKNEDEEFEEDLAFSIINYWPEGKLIQPVTGGLYVAGDGYILKVYSRDFDAYGFVFDKNYEYWGAYVTNFDLLDDVIVDYLLSGEADIQGALDEYIDLLHEEGMAYRARR